LVRKRSPSRTPPTFEEPSGPSDVFFNLRTRCMYPTERPLGSD
jgi:hypothetical protein